MTQQPRGPRPESRSTGEEDNGSDSQATGGSESLQQASGRGGSLKRVKPRLIAALASYFLLALIATFTFDGLFRTSLWLFFAFLAIKTLAHSQDEDME